MFDILIGCDDRHVGNGVLSDLKTRYSEVLDRVTKCALEEVKLDLQDTGFDRTCYLFCPVTKQQYQRAVLLSAGLNVVVEQRVAGILLQKRDKDKLPAVFRSQIFQSVDLSVIIDHFCRINSSILKLFPQLSERDVLALKQGYQELTDHERIIFRMALAGRSAKSIAMELDVSHRTIETHRANILKKFSCASFWELLRSLAAANIHLRY